MNDIWKFVFGISGALLIFASGHIFTLTPMTLGTYILGLFVAWVGAFGLGLAIFSR